MTDSKTRESKNWHCVESQYYIMDDRTNGGQLRHCPVCRQYFEYKRFSDEKGSWGKWVETEAPKRVKKQ